MPADINTNVIKMNGGGKGKIQMPYITTSDGNTTKTSINIADANNSVIS